MNATRHSIRQMAVQALYQFDARGGEDLDEVAGVIRAETPDAPGIDEAVLLAREAWGGRESADGLASELAEAWPTYRQPPVDRSILRLAYWEIAHKGVPPAVVINEAVELAKTFGSEKSPAFINGVLDKMAKRLRDGEQEG